MEKTHTHLMIGELLSESQFTEFKTAYDETRDTRDNTPGFVQSQLLLEGAGNMVLVETEWATQRDAVLYHSSRAYRVFCQKTAHLLVGNHVNKIFTVETKTVRETVTR